MANLEGGFADPVHAAQGIFRALMEALANPGRIERLAADPRAPDALAPGLAAVALTLCDHDTTLWLDPVLAADAGLADWLRFHTGAPLTALAAEAEFALATAAQLPNLDRFAPGSDEYPDTSTTLALAVPALTGGPTLTLRGPGVPGTRQIAPLGLPADFVAQWNDNRAKFPRGVDLLLVAGDELIGLPRSTRISEA